MKMAQQQAPPAAQAPIVVVVDEVQITSDAALVLAPGAQHVKDHTPCLSWTTVYDNAGAVTNYTLGQSDAKGAFLPRCRFSVDQQTGTLLDGNHVLNVLFNGAFWSRLLTALDAANLFATSMEKIGVLHQRLAGLQWPTQGSGWSRTRTSFSVKTLTRPPSQRRSRGAKILTAPQLLKLSLATSWPSSRRPFTIGSTSSNRGPPRRMR